MDKLLKRTKANVILMAVITLIMGLILVIFPGAAARTLCLILGWVLLAVGLASIIFYIKDKDRSPQKLLLILGVIELGIGLWMVIAPGFWVRFLFVIFGLLLLFHGVGDCSDALEMKRSGYDKWWLSLVFGILTLGLGILIIIAPFATAATMVVICGIALIFDALTDLFIALRLSAAIKES